MAKSMNIISRVDRITREPSARCLVSEYGSSVAPQPSGPSVMKLRRSADRRRAASDADAISSDDRWLYCLLADHQSQVPHSKYEAPSAKRYSVPSNRFIQIKTGCDEKFPHFRLDTVIRFAEKCDVL